MEGEKQLIFNRDGMLLAHVYPSSRRFPTPKEYKLNYPIFRMYEPVCRELLQSAVDSLPEDLRLAFDLDQIELRSIGVVNACKKAGEEYGMRIRGKPFSVSWVYTRIGRAYGMIGNERLLELFVPFVQESIATNIWEINFPIELNDLYPNINFVNTKLSDLKLSRDDYLSLDDKQIIGKWLVEEGILFGSYKNYLPNIRLLNLISQPTRQLSLIEANRLKHTISSIKENIT